MVAVAHRLCLQRGGIRAGARFGEAIARQKLHGGELRTPLLAHFFGRAAVDHPRAHIVDRYVGRRRCAARGERLENQRRVEPTEACAADILANINAGEAERPSA